jgi:hypothetical protein
MRKLPMTTWHRSDPGFGSGRSRYPGTFLLAFREAVAGMGWQIRRWLGDAVECVDAEQRQQVVGLENLFRRARRAERSNWTELIADFLKTSQLGPIDHPPEDLASVADKLLVRLGPPMSPGAQGLPVWQQEIEGTPLVLCLVIDFPQSMFYVTRAMVENSDQPGEEWLKQALANLLQQTPAECFKVIHEEVGLYQSSIGDAYDSSRVLLLDSVLPDTRQYGCMVAMPGRDELLVLPVTAQSLSFLPLLKAVAVKNFKSAPYPISSEVFWIKDGQWRLMAIELSDSQANIQPPEEFLPILHELMPQDEANEEGSAEEPQDN